MALGRVGKRIAIGLENELWLVLHLMIAGRLHWREPGVKLARKLALAAFDFPNGSLLLTESGTKKVSSARLTAMLYRPICTASPSSQPSR